MLADREFGPAASTEVRPRAVPISVECRATRRWASLVGLAAAVVAACSGGATPDGTQGFAVFEHRDNKVERSAEASVLITVDPAEPTTVVDSIGISPISIVADPGETVRLSANAFGPGGEPLPDIKLVWSMVDLRAGTVSKSGRLQGSTTPGVYADSVSVTGIQNTPEGIKYASAFASVTIIGQVSSARLSSVAIIPDSPALLKHQIYRLRAVGLDENGLVIPGVKFVWRLSDDRLGRINNIGYLTVEGDDRAYPRVVSVTGIWDGVNKSAFADVTVVSTPELDTFLTVHALPQRFFLDPGDRMQLRAVALNGLGELAAGTILRWSMAVPAAGAIDGNGNFVAGTAAGVYTKAVRVEAVVPGERGFMTAEDYASVVIRPKKEPRRIKAVFVSPEIVVARDGRVTIRVRAVDEGGDPVENVNIRWETLKGEVGEISPLGTFRAGSAPGNYPAALRVRAEQRLGEEVIARSETVDVVVTGTLSAAEISPSLAVVGPGRTVHFSLTGRDENAVDLSGLVVIWSVSDERIGSIDAFGNFTAGPEPGLYEGAIRARIVQTVPIQR